MHGAAIGAVLTINPRGQRASLIVLAPAPAAMSEIAANYSPKHI